MELTSGEVGVGISIGGEAACFIIEQHLARFAEGQGGHSIAYKSFTWVIFWLIFGHFLMSTVKSAYRFKAGQEQNGALLIEYCQIMVQSRDERDGASSCWKY